MPTSLMVIKFHTTPKEEAVIREIMDYCLEMGIHISSAQALRSLVTFGIELHLAKKRADAAGRSFNGQHLVDELQKELDDD
jgi:hypothetical protein